VRLAREKKWIGLAPFALLIAKMYPLDFNGKKVV